jgi:hypothetical protein
MKTEEWRAVVGLEGWYEVSSHGRVRRVMPAKGTVVGTIIKPTLSTRDRIQVTLSRNGKQKTYPVHRLVASAFLGPCPDDKETNHIDYDHKNNRADNLEYITRQENMTHSYQHGHALTAVKGSASPNTKLTEADVIAIRQSPLKRADVATLYGIAAVTVKHIRARRSWRHI